jgi:glycosyltransferase involved in cell wall biosynthesis
LDLLIEAFHLLLQSVPDARLKIVGKGPERQMLERKIAGYGLAERVKLLGFRPNREAMEHVATASVFVLPSFVEALGVAYLEAMSLGVPVIGVLGQGIGDVIRHGENGLLIAPRDVLAVHDAMLQLARNPTLTRTMGAAAQETFRAGPYAWERNAAEHAELYKSLLETRD